MRIYEPLGLVHTYDLVAICENDLKPKNFSAYGHGSIYYIYKGAPRHCGRGLISTHAKQIKYKNLFG